MDEAVEKKPRMSTGIGEMFQVFDEIADFNTENTGHFKIRRSSILKVQRNSGEIYDEEELQSHMERKSLKKRVSFAEKCQVKELHTGNILYDIVGKKDKLIQISQSSPRLISEELESSCLDKSMFLNASYDQSFEPPEEPVVAESENQKHEACDFEQYIFRKSETVALESDKIQPLNSSQCISIKSPEDARLLGKRKHNIDEGNKNACIGKSYDATNKELPLYLSTALNTVQPLNDMLSKPQLQNSPLKNVSNLNSKTSNGQDLDSNKMYFSGTFKSVCKSPTNEKDFTDSKSGYLPEVFPTNAIGNYLFSKSMLERNPDVGNTSIKNAKESNKFSKLKPSFDEFFITNKENICIDNGMHLVSNKKSKVKKNKIKQFPNTEPEQMHDLNKSNYANIPLDLTMIRTESLTLSTENTCEVQQSVLELCPKPFKMYGTNDKSSEIRSPLKLSSNNDGTKIGLEDMEITCINPGGGEEIFSEDQNSFSNLAVEGSSCEESFSLGSTLTKGKYSALSSMADKHLSENLQKSRKYFMYGEQDFTSSGILKEGSCSDIYFPLKLSDGSGHFPTSPQMIANVEEKCISWNENNKIDNENSEKKSANLIFTDQKILSNCKKIGSENSIASSNPLSFGRKILKRDSMLSFETQDKSQLNETQYFNQNLDMTCSNNQQECFLSKFSESINDEFEMNTKNYSEMCEETCSTNAVKAKEPNLSLPESFNRSKSKTEILNTNRHLSLESTSLSNKSLIFKSILNPDHECHISYEQNDAVFSECLLTNKESRAKLHFLYADVNMQSEGSKCTKEKPSEVENSSSLDTCDHGKNLNRFHAIAQQSISDKCKQHCENVNALESSLIEKSKCLSKSDTESQYLLKNSEGKLCSFNDSALFKFSHDITQKDLCTKTLETFQHQIPNAQCINGKQCDVEPFSNDWQKFQDIETNSACTSLKSISPAPVDLSLIKAQNNEKTVNVVKNSAVPLLEKLESPILQHVKVRKIAMSKSYSCLPSKTKEMASLKKRLSDSDHPVSYDGFSKNCAFQEKSRQRLYEDFRKDYETFLGSVWTNITSENSKIDRIVNSATKEGQGMKSPCKSNIIYALKKLKSSFHHPYQCSDGLLNFSELLFTLKKGPVLKPSFSCSKFKITHSVKKTLRECDWKILQELSFESGQIKIKADNLIEDPFSIKMNHETSKSVDAEEKTCNELLKSSQLLYEQNEFEHKALNTSDVECLQSISDSILQNSFENQTASLIQTFGRQEDSVLVKNTTFLEKENLSINVIHQSPFHNSRLLPENTKEEKDNYFEDEALSPKKASFPLNVSIADVQKNFNADTKHLQIQSSQNPSSNIHDAPINVIHQSPLHNSRLLPENTKEENNYYVEDEALSPKKASFQLNASIADLHTNLNLITKHPQIQSSQNPSANIHDDPINVHVQGLVGRENLLANQNNMLCDNENLVENFEETLSDDVFNQVEINAVPESYQSGINETNSEEEHEDDSDVRHYLRLYFEREAKKDNYEWRLRNIDKNEIIFEIMLEKVLILVPRKASDCATHNGADITFTFNSSGLFPDPKIAELGYVLFVSLVSDTLIQLPLCPKAVVEKLRGYIDIADIGRLFMRDIDLISTVNHYSALISDNILRISVNVLNWKKSMKFCLIFPVNLKTYPMEKIVPDLEFIYNHNSVNKEEVLCSVGNIQPGEDYLYRMVEAGKDF